ncbi:MAG: 3-deoxy-manno-octulosonate cytidylyltransferase, partial [Phormidesmis sp. FL-bin-119]|nr:3-deoxy-manno-octulosonate cytidylyltransferase [Pedobacter sp.]
RVYEQCVKSSRLDEIVVATDDERIRDHVHQFGGIAVMTSPDHASGTDRCNEVSQHFPDYDICINIQGDEPMIDPHQIDLVCRCFDDSNAKLATLVKRITTTEELFNPNTPKVIVNKDMEAIYFSRSTIPYLRNSVQDTWLSDHTYYKHIGIYGYRTTVLSEITKLEISGLELAEALEQLRWLENGYKIKVAITEKESQAIDTPEDLEKLLAQLIPKT